MSYDVSSNGGQTVTTDMTQPKNAMRPYDASPRTRAVARGLGWFSIGLGLSELLLPRALSRAIGVREDHTLLLSVLGVRELVSGLGILAQPGRSSTWLKSRVAGDMIDLGLLGAAFGTRKRDAVKLAVAAAAVAGVTALDIWCAVQQARGQETGATGPNRRFPAQASSSTI